MSKQQNTFEKVYEIVKQIPVGKVTTYGIIASIMGNPRLARAVGYALHAVPEDRMLPCHRVVNRKGELSAAFQYAGVNQQRILLEDEYVEFEKDGTVVLEKHLWYGPEGEEN